MSYIVKAEYEELRTEYWMCGNRWSFDRWKAARFATEAAAREHIRERLASSRGDVRTLSVEAFDDSAPEFDVKIERTEVTSVTVRVRAKDEKEAKRIVYEGDCRSEYDSEFETAESSLETEYYATEVMAP